MRVGVLICPKEGLLRVHASSDKMGSSRGSSSLGGVGVTQAGTVSRLIWLARKEFTRVRRLLFVSGRCFVCATVCRPQCKRHTEVNRLKREMEGMNEQLRKSQGDKVAHAYLSQFSGQAAGARALGGLGQASQEVCRSNMVWCEISAAQFAALNVSTYLALVIASLLAQKLDDDVAWGTPLY